MDLMMVDMADFWVSHLSLLASYTSDACTWMLTGLQFCRWASCTMLTCVLAVLALRKCPDLLHPCRSVKRFAEEYKSKGFPIHGLINNAGIFLVKPETTADGFEVRAHSQGVGLDSLDRIHFVR